MSDLVAEIRDSMRELPGVSVLVLFGSRATGNPRPDSDLDVAILPAPGAADSRRKLLGHVAAALAELAPAGRVDVVFLDEVPELLRQRIMETGRVVILREPRRWRELRVRTMREHGDREPYRRMLRLAQKRRLLRGSVAGGGDRGRP